MLPTELTTHDRKYECIVKRKLKNKKSHPKKGGRLQKINI